MDILSHGQPYSGDRRVLEGTRDQPHEALQRRSQLQLGGSSQAARLIQALQLLEAFAALVHQLFFPGLCPAPLGGVLHEVD
ncbi:MAG: hypothetical protein OQK96_12165, partial [Gammaproteobacteria bacterium]|nr:hypothetical protein [Gammaproteobacteria bacterium]